MGVGGIQPKRGYNRQIKNLFNWMIKRDYVSTNSAAKIEEIMLGEYEPHVEDLTAFGARYGTTETNLVQG